MDQQTNRSKPTRNQKKLMESSIQMKYYLHEAIFQMLKLIYNVYAYSTQKQLLQTSGYMLCLTGIENLVSLWVDEYALHFLSLGILDEDFTAFLAFSHEHYNSSLFVDIATADRE